MKYFKIVYGFDGDTQYHQINGNELHKANFVCMTNGKAMFESGFFNNQSGYALRIEPDWHRVNDWNRGYKMEAVDYEDVEYLQKSYRETLEKGKLLAEYIVKNNRIDLLKLPANEALLQLPEIEYRKNEQLEGAINKLADNLIKNKREY